MTPLGQVRWQQKRCGWQGGYAEHSLVLELEINWLLLLLIILQRHSPVMPNSIGVLT